jgi:glutamate-1-semialdehyde 2,1-aminomutase
MPDPGRSAQLRTRAEARIPGGVNSNVRLLAPRTFFERGSGARLRDVDGREYIDYLLGQGPAILGHAPPGVQDEVALAVRDGMVFGAQHEREVEAAELVCEVLGWPEMLRFGVSGTESVQAALRLARAATGRRRFVRFEGHYHGWLDATLAAFPPEGGARPASRGQLDYLVDSVTLPWNDLDAVARTLEADRDIAAVITEPVMLNAGAILPREGYLRGLRELCDAYGVVLVFDEVITGFRVALGGAAARFGVTPDLAVYGKAVAAGWPVSVLAGREDLMERFGTGEVNHSGTFNGSVMAAAAVSATVRRLRDADPYAGMERHGEAVQALLAELAGQHGLDLHLQGLGMAFHATFGAAGTVHDHRGLARAGTARYERLARVLCAHGVWVAGRGVWYVSAAHGDTELNDLQPRLDAAFTAFARDEA